MHLPRLTVLAVLGFALGLAPLAAQDKDAKKPDDKPAKPDNRLPHSKLPPAELIPNLCVVKYRVSTASPECQAFFDQGLAFYYSYTWAEAVRSFETATKLDPSCAMAWLGLSKACEKWGRAAFAPPLKKAQELMADASHREGLLIRARLQEKGIIPGITPENRKKEAIKTLDEVIALHDDDEEGWFARAQLAEGPNAAVPFYKALLRINPQHPGAHHELLHHYENIHRPALGWQHAVGYMQSSPGLPHAFHMQAHLAMRIGKWEHTTDNSARAVELEEAYQKRMKIKPNDAAIDYQFPHHLETLMRSLIHDGRYKEARALKAKCESYKFEQKALWFRLFLAEGDSDAALKIADGFSKDKVTASYMRALVYLRKGDAERAAPEVNVLQEAFPGKRNDKNLELKLWEVQGLLACQRGEEGGLKLLAKIVAKTKDDYGHHAWGQGAYFMESWGAAALKLNRLDSAEEAFLEALAHDSGSARGALGMQVVCERQHRDEEAVRFAELAQRCWRHADPGALQHELQRLRGTQPTGGNEFHGEPAMSYPIRTFGDLLRRLGDVSPDRIRFQPAPGTATLMDVEHIANDEGVLCELVEGVLLEKVMGFTESQLGSHLLMFLMSFVLPRNLGIVTGADGTVELMPELVRIPDVAFTSWDRIPGRRRPAAPIPRLVPNLAAEVLSISNRPGEMAAKRQDYFAAGVELVWEIDPDKRTVDVYTSLAACVTLGVANVLDGGTVLPGFRLPLAELFGELDRHG